MRTFRLPSHKHNIILYYTFRGFHRHVPWKFYFAPKGFCCGRNVRWDLPVFQRFLQSQVYHVRDKSYARSKYEAVDIELDHFFEKFSLPLKDRGDPKVRIENQNDTGALQGVDGSKCFIILYYTFYSLIDANEQSPPLVPLLYDWGLWCAYYIHDTPVVQVMPLVWSRPNPRMVLHYSYSSSVNLHIVCLPTL